MNRQTKMPEYKLASRMFHPEPTVVRVGNHEIGNGSATVIAGPCSVESREQIIQVAAQLKEFGAHMLRGGAFKPRTSPYAFQGLGETGLQYLAEASELTGLPIVSEIMDPSDVPVASEYIQVIQIGARNMQNYPLLKAVGRLTKPILLKRGLTATIDEWLLAAEYILHEGNANVILCERAIRTFNNSRTRNTLDLSAIPVIKDLSHLPIIIDPSHGTGVARYVPSMSLASLAAGADGLILEVHPTPDQAVSDGAQSLTPSEFNLLMRQVHHYHAATRSFLLEVGAHG
ncbi:3-deoxy-7-phosphoheptulonate synthase [Alicyclobacillus mengziensis]|nr:3-deoxy-7-phosphoheptulonate synthase [Alicyclobacillus mengziensis]